MKTDRPHRHVISLNAVRADRAYRRLLDDLVAYCEAHIHEEPWAEDQFYGSPPANNDDAVLYEAFLDWMAFDYRDWDGRTMLERFIAEAAPAGDAEPALLRSWVGSRIGLYRVLSQSGDLVGLRDCCTEDSVTVQSEPDMDPFSTADLVICRVLPVGEGFRFGPDVRTGPSNTETVIRQALERELEVMRRQCPDATWHDLFATRWPLVHDAMTRAIVTRRVPPALSQAMAPPSLGLTEAPAWASPLHRQVAARLEAYLQEEDLSQGDRQRAQQLWWDAVACLKPRSGKPEGWAAGTAYAMLRFIIDDEMTQGEIAEAFSVSVSTVGARSRDIVEALGLQELDDRYCDPLDPRARLSASRGFIDFRTLMPGAEAAAALQKDDPFGEFFLDDPDGFERLRTLDMEGYALLGRQEWEAARERFATALELCPSAPPPRNHTALSYLLEGRPEDAVEAALPILNTYPALIYTLALVAFGYAQMGKREEADSYAGRALETYIKTREADPFYPASERQSDLALVVEALDALDRHQAIVDLMRGEEMDEVKQRTLTRAAASALQLGLTEEARRWAGLATGRD